MGLVEPVSVPEGYTLFVEGLSSRTVRDSAGRRGWPGLARPDAVLFAWWLTALGDLLGEVHTDVRVGLVPVLPDEVASDWARHLGAVLYPLRIDACIQVRGRWCVVEIKPDAGYLSLGQILTYKYFAGRTNKQLAGCVPVVLTDRVQECMRPVFEHHGVVVAEAGYQD